MSHAAIPTGPLRAPGSSRKGTSAERPVSALWFLPSVRERPSSRTALYYGAPHPHGAQHPGYPGASSHVIRHRLIISRCSLASCPDSECGKAGTVSHDCLHSTNPGLLVDP